MSRHKENEEWVNRLVRRNTGKRFVKDLRSEGRIKWKWFIKKRRRDNNTKMDLKD
jgi:hypothetical protein